MTLTKTICVLGLTHRRGGETHTEPCPNGCGPLWPQTWEQNARALRAMLIDKRTESDMQAAYARDLVAERDAARAEADHVGVQADQLTAALANVTRERDAARADVERLARWKLLAEHAPGECAETIRERALQADALAPIVDAWRNRVAEVERERDEARAAVERLTALVAAAARADRGEGDR